MSQNKTNIYDIEPHLAEVYDQSEIYQDDVELIRDLIGDRKPLRILEPFCGTGRILLPLAVDGHQLYGFDQAKGMLDRARMKVGQLPAEAQQRVTLTVADAIGTPWPRGFDLVILGCNCLYELATPEEQERCIISAAGSLNPGGYVYVDNDHMEGELARSWRRPGVAQGFPTGNCADDTRVESYIETIWWDAPRRLVRFRRGTRVTLPDGTIVEKEYFQQKHPVSTLEVWTWLEKHGFMVRHLFGDRMGSPYTDISGRAIFWAKKD
ncbi:MAG: class I SAM-dependent methyltransferase [Dehalococcoidales bacterium]|nr:MAG: class I SAM-dependent methyltransferase [Dehalococcoidales bacterium]